jgi:hypothetical protein
VLRKFPPLPLRFALAALACAAVLPACEKKSPPPEPTPPSTTATPRDTPPDRVTETSPAALLATLHHAAQEMALDGFQFDRPALGWPFDRRSASTSAHLQTLVDHGYLDAADLVHFADIDIANLSDSDPGDTAFAKLTRQGAAHTIRKDGLVDSNSIEPPRTPTWLPK